MSRIPAPRALADQMGALLDAARASEHPRRNETILLLLSGTGMRASELCSLKMCHLDFNTRSCVVMGKVIKRRTVYFDRKATKVFWQYLREQARELDEPIFFSDRGTRAGEKMTRQWQFFQSAKAFGTQQSEHDESLCRTCPR